MGPNIIPEYRLKKSMWSEEAPFTLEELKDLELVRLLRAKPILARGYYDYLIEFDPDSEPPVVRWKEELLKELAVGYIQSIRIHLEKVEELQTYKY